MALSRLGSLEEAEAEYIRALEIRPNWLLAIDKLEILREKRRELAEQAAQ
jgi:hypothetical protein